MQHARASLMISVLAVALGAACATGKGNGENGSAAVAVSADNTGMTELSEADKAAGWRLLFDGKTTNGWRGFGRPTFPEAGWKVVNGVLQHDKFDKKESGDKAGDIITEEEFDNFELVLEFRLTPRGNSGIKYLVDENLVVAGKREAVSWEYQILDDEQHPDAKKGKDGNRRLGGLYDLIAPPADKVTRPIGAWNEARIIVDGNNIEHWLNGKKTVSFVRGSPEIKALIAGSKFKERVGFGEASKGRIVLQDHKDEIAFRNIRIRTLPARVSQATK